MRFNHLTGQDGLSQSQAYCIFQDSKGFIWIGTQDGLNRYDGYQFKVYKNDPFDSTTLTHNWIWSIAEDNKGDLWIGTFQGLCKYIRKDDQFIQYIHDPNDSTTISGNRTNFVLRDKKGRIWISAWGNGLNRYDEQSGSFIRHMSLPDDPATISSNGIRTLYCDQSGTIWIGTWNEGLNKVIDDANGIRFKRILTPLENNTRVVNQINSIAELDNTLLLGNYQSGISIFLPLEQRFTTFNEFPSKDVNKIFTDSKKNIWIGTNSGLFLKRNDSTELIHFQNTGDPDGISSNTIYDIYEDRQGIIWISGNGIDLYDPRKNRFRSYSETGNTNKRLAHNNVWSISEDGTGNIWIGTSAGPINIFDPGSKTIKHVTISDEQGNIAQNIRKIIFHDGVFWIATNYGGLVWHEKSSGKSKFLMHDNTSPLYGVAMIQELFLDHHQNLWIGTADNGLTKLTLATNQYEQFKYDPDADNGIGSNYINSILEDSKGNIWIGHWGDGISVFNVAQKTFSHYQYNPRNAQGLSDQIVISISQENDSIFWVCTHTGLNRLNANTGIFTHYFEKDGLANNVTYGILKDSQQRLWVSTNKGLSRFDPDQKTFVNYTKDDGLTTNEFNAGAYLKSSNGEFYFGGIDGFTVFNPDLFTDDTLSTPILLTSFRLHNRILPVPGPHFELKHNNNYLTFQFAALDLSAPHKIRYAVKLEGLRDQWENIGNNHTATYTDLAPGKYIFRVKAFNANGIWDKNEIALPFIIHPPFWKSYWFIAICLVLVVSILYGTHRYQLNQSLKVERLRTKIASDLHDEVGSSLTRISLYSDLLQSGTEKKETSKYLLAIRNLSREIVGTMSDVIWSIDNKNESVEALIDRIKDFATELSDAKNIHFEFEVSGINKQKTLDPTVKQNLYLICKEAITNIVKHSVATHIQINMINSSTAFQVTIRDNGQGIQIEKNTGNGLRNMKRRAEALGATLSVQNDAGVQITLVRRPL